MLHTGFNSRIKRMQEVIEPIFMPSVCYIKRTVESISDSGATEKAMVNVLYRGARFIPCRIDPSRYYRQPRAFGQEFLVSDFEIHFPFDVDITIDDVIIIDDIEHQVRKFNNFGVNNADLEVLVTRITGGTN